MGQTFIKIRENEKTSCFSTDQPMGCVLLIKLMNDALKASEGGTAIGDYLRSRIKSEVSMTEDAWTEAAERIRHGPCDDRFADIDADQDQATLSEWAIVKERTVISGAISRLTGCYEMSLVNGKLDENLFAENVYRHCSVLTVGPDGGQSMSAMKM